MLDRRAETSQLDTHLTLTEELFKYLVMATMTPRHQYSPQQPAKIIHTKKKLASQLFKE